MKCTKSEIKILVDKYKKEGLRDNQICKRLKDLYEMDEYIKFAKKYLKRYI